MSNISLIIIALGAAATLLFLAGFLRGVRQAIAGRDAPAATTPVEDSGHLGSAIFAVIASAAIIAAIGFFPSAIYLGPLLAIGTAAAVGIAFYLDRGN
jgi:hypothetical protein